MNPGELLSLLILIAFALGGFYACKTLAGRLLFTFVMPVLYSMLWLMCAFIVGSLSSTVFVMLNDNLMSGLMILILSGVCIGLFVVQIFAMTRDPRGGPDGYAIRRNGKLRISDTRVRLQRLPTRKRMGG